MKNSDSYSSISEWANGLFDQAHEYPVGLITGLPQDDVEQVAEQITSDKIQFCGSFFEHKSCTKIIEGSASSDQILKLASWPMRPRTPTERLYEALLEREGFVLNNLQLVPTGEIYKLQNVRRKRMASGIPFAILVIGFGDEDALKNKMAPLAASLRHRKIQMADLSDLHALVLKLGLKIPEEKASEVSTLIFLYSERHGSLREMLQLYRRRHGSELGSTNLINLLSEMNPECVADKDALAQSGEKGSRRNRKTKLSTRPTPPPSAPLHKAGEDRPGLLEAPDLSVGEE